MITVLADENVPFASVRLLRNSGIDVRSVAEEAPGARDGAVLDLARADARFLLTFDRDFGELIFRHGHAAPPAIVFLRFVPVSPEEPALVFQALLARSEIDLQGRFTVVTRDQVRQRPLP